MAARIMSVSKHRIYHNSLTYRKWLSLPSRKTHVWQIRAGTDMLAATPGQYRSRGIMESHTKSLMDGAPGSPPSYADLGY